MLKQLAHEAVGGPVSLPAHLGAVKDVVACVAGDCRGMVSRAAADGA